MKSLITFFALLLSASIAKGQIIITVVGNGSPTYGGDGSSATLASIFQPRGVVFDATGNMYIDDDWNNRIRKVVPSGTISTIAGNGSAAFTGDLGPATDAALYGPAPIAVDLSGNVYIADYYNHRIRKVNPSGIITTFAGNGLISALGDGGPAINASFIYPWGIAVDAAGNVYVADPSSNRVRKVTVSTGVITTIAGTGTAGYDGDGSLATNAELSSPNGLWVDAANNVYIADAGNNCVRKVSTSGNITTIAGNGTAGFSGDGAAATNAKLNYPVSIAVDHYGNIYIADNLNNRIRKVNSYGIISTIAGNGTAGFGGDYGSAVTAELNQPFAVTVDTGDNVYIADSYNNRIRKIIHVHTAAQNLANGYQEALVIFPNPSEGNFNINVLSDRKGPAKIVILNSIGQTVMEQDFVTGDPINIKLECAGVYFVNVHTPDAVLSGKIIVEP